MKQLLLVSSIFLLIIEPLFSQTNKYGKITQEQWNITKCNFDSTANSLVLFDVGSISIQGKEGVNNFDSECSLQIEFFSLIYERHMRIKILCHDSTKVGIHSFTLRSIDGKKDYLKSFYGVLIKKEKNKEVKTKFNAKNLIKTVEEDGSCKMTLELTDIKEGSIIDLVVIIETNIFNETPEWKFSSNIPTLYSEISLSIPDFIKYQKKSDILNILTYKSFSRPTKYGVSYTIPEGWKYYSYSYFENHETYSLREIPASQDSLANNKLKYLITSINLFSVSCNKGAFIKQK